MSVAAYLLLFLIIHSYNDNKLVSLIMIIETPEKVD